MPNQVDEREGGLASPGTIPLLRVAPAFRAGNHFASITIQFIQLQWKSSNVITDNVIKLTQVDKFPISIKEVLYMRRRFDYCYHWIMLSVYLLSKWSYLWAFTFIWTVLGRNKKYLNLQLPSKCCNLKYHFLLVSEAIRWNFFIRR